jgi:alkylation response protein AidB-like acyl-CoA dehydrogenase
VPPRAGEYRFVRVDLPPRHELGWLGVALADADAAGAVVAGRDLAGCCRDVVEDSFRIHGGYGFSKEYEIERLYREAPMLLIGEGPPTSSA